MRALKKQWFVYCLLNQQHRIYTGITYDINVERRLEEHNGLKTGGAKATRAFRPWQLVYIENGFKSRSEAQKREASLKQNASFKRALKTPFL